MVIASHMPSHHLHRGLGLGTILRPLVRNRRYRHQIEHQKKRSNPYSPGSTAICPDHVNILFCITGPSKRSSHGAVLLVCRTGPSINRAHPAAEALAAPVSTVRPQRPRRATSAVLRPVPAMAAATEAGHLCCHRLNRHFRNSSQVRFHRFTFGKPEEANRMGPNPPPAPV